MRIGPHRRVGCLPLVALSVDTSPRFPNLPWQSGCCKVGADKPDPGDHRGSLIHRCVNFVIRSFWEVRLRDRGNANHGAQQKRNERPKHSPHRDASK
jgi:hypothetical protein